MLPEDDAWQDQHGGPDDPQPGNLTGGGGSDPGGGGGPGGEDGKGNNGVGNGIDPPPPGDPDLNDGEGSGPGEPGVTEEPVSDSSTLVYDPVSGDFLATDTTTQAGKRASKKDDSPQA